MRVAIIGIGYTRLRPATPECSFKELTFEAARLAYEDAGLRFDEISSFVTCAEDFNEGISIFDEYTPDQLGAVQKPMHTVTHDGLCGIADAAMQIRAGIAEVVVVEAHSKASNIVTPDWVLDYALDPIYNRPLNFNPHALAALEMNRFIHETGITPAQCTEVAAQNRARGQRNPLSAYPFDSDAVSTESSRYFSYPLHEEEMAKAADGCVVVVLAGENRAHNAKHRPIWLKGIGFVGDTPALESRDWVQADYARLAGAMAYKQAGVTPHAIDLFEVDDTYAFKQIQHLIALGFYDDATSAVDALDIAADETRGVNLSGGSLGMGHALEASGLYRLLEIVLQLRGEAGVRQMKDARTGLAQSWRGVPTSSGAVAILGTE